MSVQTYRDLIVWQKAMAFAINVYRITANFPSDEKFGLTSQIRRAVVSIPSNIAEGQGRMSTGEFKQFLGHARGSLFEVETQLYLAADLAYIEKDDCQPIFHQATEIAKLLNGLIRSLSNKTNDSR